MQNRTFLLLALIGLSLMGAAYEGILYWHNVDGPRNLFSVWQVFFVILLALWIDADSKAYPQVYRPYEYGYLVFLYWIPYLPFYLWRTRGPAVGTLMLAGFVGLWFLSYLVQWLLYFAR
jgi:hypothetical protein